MNYLSVCSGIEAASVAWHSLGWHPVAFSEIEPFPCAVLAHHFPNVPNLGDMTKYKEWKIADRIDLLVGGTPCQSFSVAGLRGGLADPRGNLALVYCGILDHLRPRWFVWENVPGVLSSNEGRDFGSFLGAVAELGYSCAYRVLDAQYFGVPQRRRRVFVVGYLGDWRRAAAVLFERESLRGNPAPRKAKGQETARTLRGRANASHREDNDNYVTAGDVCGSLCADSHPGSYSGQDAYTGRLITHTLRGEHDACEDGTGRRVPIVCIDNEMNCSETVCGPLIKDSPTGGGRPLPAVCYSPQNDVPFDRDKPYLKCSVCGVRHYGPGDNCQAHTPEGFTNRGIETGDVAETVRSTSHGALPMVCHAFTCEQEPKWEGGDMTAHTLDGAQGQAVCAFSAGTSSNARSIAIGENSPPLRSADSGTNRVPSIQHGSTVRRLTPRECERLQGFPDGWTLIPYRGKPAADGPRYKAIGNSMAVPVMRWIGERIQMVDELITTTHCE